MKSNWLLSLALLTAVALTPAVNAQLAIDNADNAPYGDGWSTADNGGTGFNAWSTVTDSYLETGAGVVDGTRSFALFGFNANGQAIRPLTSPLASGSYNLSIRIQIDSAITNFMGFNLKSAPGASVGDNELLAIGITSSTDIFSLFGATTLTIDMSNDGSVDEDLLNFTVDFDAAAGTYTVSGTNVTEGFVATPQSGSLKASGTSVGAFGYAALSPQAFQNIVFDSPTVVPEPSTLGLAVLGTLGIAILRRRRRL